MSSVSFAPLLGVADPANMARTMRASAPEEPGKAAAQQFEAILVRQLLGDALKPVLGAEPGSEAPGSDVYQYLVTDIVAQSVAQGGGLGIAKMLTPQLTPKTAVPTEEKTS